MRVGARAWGLAAAAAFCLGMAVAVVAVDMVADSARANQSERSNRKSAVTIMHVSPGAAAFGVDEGAFYSASSLFVPLAITEIDETDLASRKIDIEKARSAALVIDSLNRALAQAGFKTYRSYQAAIAAGRREPHEAVERAYLPAADLSPADCMNLRRALDHLALAGKNPEARELMRSGARPDPWASAADTFERALDEAL